jgi:hypothetical protein
VATTLKEYLVALGFKVDEPQLRKFNSILGETTKGVLGLGEAAAATAAAIGISVNKISEQFADLGFATQRIGGSVGQLQAFRFAAEQIGISSDKAQSAVEGFASRMRSMPGMTNTLRGLLGVVYDPNNPEKAFTASIHSLTRMDKIFGHPYVATLAQRLLGLDEPTFVQFETNIGQLDRSADRFREIQKKFGIDPEQVAKDSADLFHAINDLTSDFENLAVAMGEGFIKPATDVVKWIDRMLVGFGELNKATSGWFGTLTLMAGGIAGLGILKGVGGALGRKLGLLGASEAAEVAGPGLLARAFSLTRGGAIPGALMFAGYMKNDPGNLKRSAWRRALGFPDDPNQLNPWETGGAWHPFLGNAGGKGDFLGVNRNGLAAAADKMADRYGIPRQIFRSLIGIESTWNPSAVSPVGAIGLTQLMPGTAHDLGVDPTDPMQNLAGGARYLSQLYRRFGGNWWKALAAYNAGPGRWHAGIGYADDVLGDAALGRSRGMPNAVLGGGGAGGAPVTVNQRTQVTVNGASDPHATATAVQGAQTQVNMELVRNLVGAAR